MAGGEGRADRLNFVTAVGTGYSKRVPGGQLEPDLSCTLGTAGDGGDHHHLQGAAGHAPCWCKPCSTGSGASRPQQH